MMLKRLNADFFKRLLIISTNKRAYIISFILGLLIRFIPEILSYPYPIGFDTIFYAARIKSGLVWPHWTWMFSTWLLYAILTPLYVATSVDPFLLLKLTAPVLYGLNTCGVYFFARKSLDWSIKKALFTAFFFAFQLASLRISWDLYRNILGLSILLFALSFIPVPDIKSKKRYAWFVLLSILIVFSHELVAVVMFALFWWVMASYLREGGKLRLFKASFSILPASAIFLMGVFLWSSNGFEPLNLGRNVGISLEPHPTGLFFLVNYLDNSRSVQYSTYLNLVSSVLIFFIALYSLCIPLVLVGFFRDRILDRLTVLLLLGSFNSLIMPFVALDFWDRWMLMLVYPFSFYAVNGVEQILQSGGGYVHAKLRCVKWLKVSRRMALAILLSTLLLASFSMVVSYGALSFPGTSSYVPSMYSNTVPLEDVKGTVEAIEWLNRKLSNGSGVLVHLAFFSWTYLYLDSNNSLAFYFVKDTQRALETALEYGSNPIYLIWWNTDIGWYSLSIPEGFISIFRSDRISVFQYSTDSQSERR